MGMFADYFTVKFGDTTVKGRRLSLKEIKERRAEIIEGKLDLEGCVELVRKHVTLADGSRFDPLELSESQMRTLIAELVLPKEARGISDFIGQLC